MKTYFKHKLKNLINVNKIVTIHYFEFDKNFKSAGESHDFWEIVYAEKQDIICYANGEEIKLNQGEILFHKPKEFHVLSANGKTAPSVVIISFESKSEAMRYFENKKLELPIQCKSFIYNILEEGKINFDIPFSRPDIKKMPPSSSQTLGGLQLIKNYLEILLVNLLRSQTEKEKESGNEIFAPSTDYSSKPVNEVIKILKSSVYDNLSVSDVCEKTAYGRAYLFRIFKQRTGQTIMQYYTKLKINLAKQLLRENELSVKEISDLLSFSEPNYFTKTFRRVVGVTPTAYRQRAKMHR